MVQFVHVPSNVFGHHICINFLDAGNGVYNFDYFHGLRFDLVGDGLVRAI